MSDQIFRKKSLDRISSPEQLNDYIRVANPGIWMILAAVIILLAGVCVWGIFGHLDTKTETVGTAKAGKITCYIKETDIRNVKKGTPAYIDGKEYEIAEISETPVKLKEGQLESAAFAVDDFFLAFGLRHSLFPVYLQRPVLLQLLKNGRNDEEKTG